MKEGLGGIICVFCPNTSEANSTIASKNMINHSHLVDVLSTLFAGRAAFLLLFCQIRFFHETAFPV